MSPDWPIYVWFSLGAIALMTAGVFKAFSGFIMKALGQADVRSGMDAMQQINRVVLHTEFVASLIALAPLSVMFAAYAGIALEGQLKAPIIAATIVYVPAVFGVTLFGNVPLNKRLDQLAPSDPDAIAFWHVYLKDWTRLNHVRTISTLVTAGLYFLCVVLAL